MRAPKNRLSQLPNDVLRRILFKVPKQNRLGTTARLGAASKSLHADVGRAMSGWVFKHTAETLKQHLNFVRSVMRFLPQVKTGRDSWFFSRLGQEARRHGLKKRDVRAKYTESFKDYIDYVHVRVKCGPPSHPVVLEVHFQSDTRRIGGKTSAEIYLYVQGQGHRFYMYNGKTRNVDNFASLRPPNAITLHVTRYVNTNRQKSAQAKQIVTTATLLREATSTPALKIRVSKFEHDPLVLDLLKKAGFSMNYY